MIDSKLTFERAHELLRIDHDEGQAYWRRRVKRVNEGDRAGTLASNGYWHITIDQETYRAHRLFWFMTYGEWPDGFIDHINMNILDNRICNLRVVTNGENMQNRRSARKDNKSTGLLGAYPTKDGKKFRASIMAGKKQFHIGTYCTKEEAHEAYLKAKIIYHPTAPRLI